MKVGLSNEIKNNENRVALTPGGVRALVGTIRRSAQVLKPMQEPGGRRPALAGIYAPSLSGFAIIEIEKQMRLGLKG